jgi:gamma-glutamyltranspeptidase / glutathione hydrolase
MKRPTARFATLALVLSVSLAAVPRMALADPPIVAGGHPLAAKAALDIMAEGGNAIDAAVAAQAMLGLVEPQSSGLGGGAYLLLYDATSRRITFWDGRETAPAAATPSLFLRPDGTPMPHEEAVVGGRGVGVPGAIAMLQAAHAAAGKLPWAALFAPAIRQAEAGFPIPARLAGEIAEDRDNLRRLPALRALYLAADGSPLPAGTMLANPALADTMRLVAAQGADALLRGPIAADIVAAVQGDVRPGLLNLGDLAGYRPLHGDAVCLTLGQRRICSAGPSSSGGVAVLQTLAMVTDLDMLHRPAAEQPMVLAEAERLAFADRDRYLDDPAFTPVPVAGLLDPAYLRARAALIDPARAIATPQPGHPPGAPAGAPQPNQPEHGTTDLAIVDAQGNAVSMTTTVEAAFGARILVHGFLLNNQLTDFSFLPSVGGQPVANRVEPGKRPRSSMAPSIVLDTEGRPVALAGSAGGSRIIGYVAQTLVQILAGASAQQAVAAPHLGVLGSTVELEAGTAAAGLAEALRQRGETVRVVPMQSGNEALVRGPAGWSGGTDPRRDGAVLVGN